MTTQILSLNLIPREVLEETPKFLLGQFLPPARARIRRRAYAATRAELVHDVAARAKIARHTTFSRRPPPASSPTRPSRPDSRPCAGETAPSGCHLGQLPFLRVV